MDYYLPEGNGEKLEGDEIIFKRVLVFYTNEDILNKLINNKLVEVYHDVNYLDTDSFVKLMTEKKNF